MTSRIRWACRRGMLELDLILGPFFEAQFAQLSAEEQRIFEQLLTVEDPTLYQWLLASKTPDNPVFFEMVQRIRAYATAAMQA